MNPGARDTSKAMTREALEAIIKKTPFAVLLQAQVTKFERGDVELKVPITPTLQQHHGFVHGAVVSFMADSGCAWAAASVAGDVVTSEYKINLIAPGVGSDLIARGSVIKEVGRHVICRADVFALRAGVEHLIATALATIVRMNA